MSRGLPSSKQTGLSWEELLARMSRELPDAVDKYTPQGRLPTEQTFRVPKAAPLEQQGDRAARFN